MRLPLTLPIPVRDALRSLRRSPLFAAMAVLSLGLALALNTTMFALVDATLRPSLPYDADGLYHVWFRTGGVRVTIPFHEELDAVRAQTHALEQVTYARTQYASVQSGTRLPEDQWVYRVPPDFFAVVGVRPLAGRTFAPAEIDAAVVSYAAWRRLLAGRTLASRPTITVGSATYTVVGVMPRGMHYPGLGDVWLPAPPTDRVPVGPRDETDGGTLVVRARAGMTIDAVRADANLAAARLAAASRVAGLGVGAQVRPARGDPARLSDLHRLLAVSVTVVLLIACANLATLMLARGIARRREVALRLALGATRGHVMRTVLAESGLLALGGAVLGALLTVWALYLLSSLGVRRVPELGDLAPVPSWRVFAFMLIAAVTAMVLCAALPALRMARTDPAGPLSDGSGTATVRSRERHAMLVVVQVALSMSLLLGAGYLVHTTLRMRGWARQFDARRLLLATVWMRERDLPASRAERFYLDLEQRARAIPGVQEAAVEGGASPAGGLVVSEQGKAGERRMNLRGYSVVSPSYLRTLGIPVVAGRDFEPGDRAGTGAAIVDEDAALRLWPDVPSPVGRMVKLGALDKPGPWVRVIGVARRIASTPRLGGIPTPPEPDIYYLPARDSSRNRTLVVRAARAGDFGLAVRVRRLMEQTSAGRGYPRVDPYLAHFENTMGFIGFLAALFGAFGAFALLLSAVGLYGVLGYMVSRRLREFAVRVALGATAGRVARIVVRQAAVLTLAGVGFGALSALAALFVYLDMMFESRWTMAVVLVLAELVVFGVAAMAALGPARRAARADPMQVIRST